MENKKTTKKSVLFLLCMILSFNVLNAQKHHAVLKDSLDGAFDLSDFLIYANGFIVVPTIITEPAVGGFGAAIAPIFLKKRAPVIEADGKKRFINPDITGGVGMYTANKSWMAGAFRSATLVKPKILYRAFAAYGDMNLSFYANNLPNQKDEEFKLNFKSTIFYTQWLKQFNNAKWSVGPQYLFLNSKINLPDFNLPPPFVDPKDIKSTISQLGAALQFDGRDNIFTQDKGIRIQSDFFW